jgi:hypothetical protein
MPLHETPRQIRLQKDEQRDVSIKIGFIYILGPEATKSNAILPIVWLYYNFILEVVIHETSFCGLTTGSEGVYQLQG